MGKCVAEGASAHHDEGHMCPHPGRGHGDGGSAGGSVGHAAGRGSRNMIVVPCYCSMLLFPDMVIANYRLLRIGIVYPYELERARRETRTATHAGDREVFVSAFRIIFEFNM